MLFNLAFSLDLRVSGFFLRPCNSGISVPYSSRILLELIPIGLQKQTFQGVSLSHAGSQGQSIWYVAQSFTFSRKSYIFWESFLIMGSPPLQWGPGQAVSLHLFCFGGAAYLVLRSFSRKIILYVAISLFCLSTPPS